MAVMSRYNNCMGGYGSGRQYGRPLADSSLRIDIAWMLRSGFASDGFEQTGTLSWSCRGDPAGNISYTANMRDPENASLELRFTTTRHSGGEKVDHVQGVPLSYTEPNFGGRRWWMHCPANGSRVGKLYCPMGAETFASRTAYRIGYYSQRIGARDKPFEALFRLQKRLGCKEGWEMPIRRPKGMWCRTYARLEQQYWDLDRECSAQMMAVVGRLQR